MASEALAKSSLPVAFSIDSSLRHVPRCQKPRPVLHSTVHRPLYRDALCQRSRHSRQDTHMRKWTATRASQVSSQGTVDHNCRVEQLKEKGSGWELTVTLTTDMKDIKEGDSLYFNGEIAIVTRNEGSLQLELTAAAAREVGLSALQPGSQVQLSKSPPKKTSAASGASWEPPSTPASVPPLSDLDFGSYGPPRDIELGFVKSAEVKSSKRRAHKILDSLHLLGGLLDRPFGGGAMVVAAGEVVLEAVDEEVEKIVSGGEVDDRTVTEFKRYKQLLSMDLKLVAAARKDATLLERCEQAKERCKGALQRAELLG